MPTEIATPLIAAAGATALAIVTYALTKKREREAELRKERLAHYKDFIASLGGVVSGEESVDGKRAYARACNNLNLVAPQLVLKALQAFQEEIKITNPNKSRENHDILLSRLLYEIRKDLGVWPRDSEDLAVRIWASGVPTNSKK